MCPRRAAENPNNQVISHTGFESPCSAQGTIQETIYEVGELPLLHFGYPIGFVPASRDGVYIQINRKIHPADWHNSSF